MSLWGPMTGTVWGPVDRFLCTPFERFDEYKLINVINMGPPLQVPSIELEDPISVLHDYKFMSSYSFIYEHGVEITRSMK
jgi:hypothetical protein